MLSAPTATTVSRHVESGEEVEITLHDGKVFEMTVKTIDEKNIIGFSKGRRVTVALNDVDSIKYRDPSVGKSIGAGAATVGTAILLYLVIVLLRLPF